MLRKLLKTGWRGSKYTRLENLTARFQLMKTLLVKKNLILRRKIKNWMFKDSIKIFQGLDEFIDGLIARKIISWSQVKL